MGLLSDKRGYEKEKLIEYIIILAGFFIVVVLVSNFLITGNEGATRATCKSSVSAKSSFVIGSGPVSGSSPTPILCQSPLKEEIVIDAKKMTNKEVIAEFFNYVDLCWDTFLEGTLSEGTQISSFVFGVENTCFRCYNIKVKNLLSEITPVEFIEYARLNKPEGSKKTYFERIFNCPSNACFFNSLDSIKSDHVYSIVFSDLKQKPSYTLPIADNYEHYNGIIIGDYNNEFNVAAGNALPCMFK